MNRKSSLDQWLGSKAIPENKKKHVLARLDSDTPDVVLEE
jgi:hypothetical protein